MYDCYSWVIEIESKIFVRCCVDNQKKLICLCQLVVQLLINFTIRQKNTEHNTNNWRDKQKKNIICTWHFSVINQPENNDAILSTGSERDNYLSNFEFPFLVWLIINSARAKKKTCSSHLVEGKKLGENFAKIRCFYWERLRRPNDNAINQKVNKDFWKKKRSAQCVGFILNHKTIFYGNKVHIFSII